MLGFSLFDVALPKQILDLCRTMFEDLKAVALLREHGIDGFKTFDVLGDPEVRSGVKTFSDWPTFPQLYVDGEFVGGLDVVTEMAEDADDGLKEELGL